MRKTNKKPSGLLTKSGVILVTIIFIVALALIFITTALMISIAGRQRVYTNAKNSQARLTVTSLSQMLWQAIYSQQITDADLVALAHGSGNGSIVLFDSSDVPGMGIGDSECSAYFYCDGPSGDASKIGIECKCEIDGIAEYYTLVLERNRGEDAPPRMFNFVVNLGDGGHLNRTSIGMTASSVSNDRGNMNRHTADDNIVFIHNPTTNDAEGLGLYSRTITDGYLSAFDSVIAADLFIIDPNPGDLTTGTAHAGLMFGNNPNLNQGGTVGDVYFWGTPSPFMQWDGSNTNPLTTTQINWNGGVNNLYFDSVEVTNPDDGTTTYSGFENFGITVDSQTLNIGGNWTYDRAAVINGLSYMNGTGSSSKWQLDEGANWVSSLGIESYTTVDDALIDTIDEVVGPDGYAAELAEAYEDGHTLNLNTATSLSAGTYLVSANATITDTINVDLSAGDVVIVVDDNKTVTLNKNGYLALLSGGDGELIFLLQSGAQIILNNDSDNSSGIYDVDCFLSTATSYYDATGLDQTKIPRCRIFSLYTGGTPVRVLGNAGNKVLTAFLGFYPQSTPNASGGGHFYVNAAGTGFCYYGRISAGGIDEIGASQLIVPYCPNDPESVDIRATAYRDLTDFSVVADESGYFTAG